MRRIELRHDRHTVSLLTDHMVFSPKYMRKILTDDVAMVCEGLIRKTCREMDIEIIDMAINSDHIHLFIKYPPKYSVSFIAKKIKGRTSRILRQNFPHLRELCPDHLWSPGCFQKTFRKSFIKNASRSVSHGWEVVEKYISTQGNLPNQGKYIKWLDIASQRGVRLKIGLKGRSAPLVLINLLFKRLLTSPVPISTGYSDLGCGVAWTVLIGEKNDK